MARAISDISNEIWADWKKPYYGAVPYLNAMDELSDMNDTYGADSAISVVSYFLANAHTWRGPVARRIKLELKQMLNDHYGKQS